MSFVAISTQAAGYLVLNTDWNDIVTDIMGDTAWTTVSTFTNGWAAGSPAPQYINVGRLVQVRGTLGTAGTATDAAFTLPTGYRPSATMSFTCNGSGTTPVTVQVSSSGTVSPQTSAICALSNIIFVTT